MNVNLPQQIHAHAAGEREGIQKYVPGFVDNPHFRLDPVHFMALQMIERSVGGCRLDDSARAFVISEVPNFLTHLAARLNEISADRFANKQNVSEIMTAFNASLKSDYFKKLMTQAELFDKQAKADHSESSRDNVEVTLRAALQIYRLAEKGEVLKEFDEDGNKIAFSH